MTSHEDAGGGAGAGGDARPRDRRETYRAAIEIPAVLRVGTRNVDCTIRDLSTKGIALSLKESVPPGMVVRVVFRLPNARRPVDIAGVLVRQAGARVENIVGLQFVDPDADSVRDIRTFVERNRSDLPFSRRAPEKRAEGPDTARIVVSEEAGSLRGLYRDAVDDVAEKGGKRRGLLARWLRRGDS